jgi:GTP cyclohydrolase I
VNGGAIETATRDLLSALGEDPAREGLRDTPARAARFWREQMVPHEFTLTTFVNEGIDEMVVQAGIPFYSLCEHHLVPFFGTATVAYVPGARLVGLSKLARTVQHHARGLQTQERITSLVAATLTEKLSPKGVGVLLRARHLCMEMRGARVAGAATTTSKLTGCFSDDARCRQEFMALAACA